MQMLNGWWNRCDFFLAVMPSFCFLFVVLDKKHGWFEGGVVLPSRKLTYPPDKAYLKMITTFSPGGICDRSLGGYLLLKKIRWNSVEEFVWSILLVKLGVFSTLQP